VIEHALLLSLGLSFVLLSMGDAAKFYRLGYVQFMDAKLYDYRLRPTAEQVGARLLLGEATKVEALEFIYRKFDLVRVKGKDNPVSIFELLGLAGEVDSAIPEEDKLLQQAFKLYRSQQWDKA